MLADSCGEEWAENASKGAAGGRAAYGSEVDGEGRESAAED